MTNWNFADIWETIAELVPAATALVHGNNELTWSEMDHRADGIARWLLDLGLGNQDKVAQYLFNCSEYMESVYGVLKVGLIPVNTNYRYYEDELVYLWDNADTTAVVFHGIFTERIQSIRSKVPKVRGWLFVDDGSGPCPDWATPYEEAAKCSMDTRTVAPWSRSGDDLYFLYTGGTTGMPKGVMWRQDDLFYRIASEGISPYNLDEGMDGVRAAIQGPGPVCLPACPLMHGTGAFTALGMLAQAGSVITLQNRSFDPTELLDTVTKRKVNVLSIVGDAFAKPILQALEAEPDRYNITSLLAIISSGVMWSEHTKEGLLKYHPNMILLDAFSSSEAIGMGASMSSGNQAGDTAKFMLGANVKVLDPDTLDEVQPGSGKAGMVALPGRNPLGYYKDDAKTNATFKVVNGIRYVIPGDFASVEADGTIHLLGRGSMCINTAGEKVYPEEVEEVIKDIDGVQDSVVVGIPDDKFGEAITATVELQPGTLITEEDIISTVKSRLASYKAPKKVRFVKSVGRAPNGKVDYARHKEETIAWAASP
ncbi:MAG: AMP-binding protein [Actinobacteria bacterium]|nr:AMP-binding protein [Actinomycetota bacterium]MCL5447519.1 AMP-binding protein [Actinomycetota bacterium]